MNTTPAETAAGVTLWHTFSVRDVATMITWLEAVGFVEHATYRDDADPTVVVHAEWVWPGGGGVMFGSERPDSGVDNAGSSSAYLVTPDVDRVFAAALEAGGSVELPLETKDYGGRGGTLRDPEGNQWSLGDYAPGT